MSTNLAESIWAACRSSLELDRWLLGELDASESATMAAHVEGCARCRLIASQLKASREESLPPLRALDLIKPSEGAGAVSLKSTSLKLVSNDSGLEILGISNPLPRRWPRLAFAAAGLAVAAAALMVFQPSPGERIKGAGAQQFSLGMYVQHGAEVRRASPGESVQAGDALRFSITSASARDAYAAVLSLDPNGRASIYFPLGDQAVLVPAGADVPLPLSTRLDASLGEEHLVGLLCTAPIALGPIRESLERGALQTPSGCQVAQWSFVKH